MGESAKPTRPTSTRLPITQDPYRDLGALKHDRMLAIARYLWRQNPIAKRGIQNLRSFVASEGFRVRSLAKDPVKRARVQRFLDKWWKLNRWDELLSKRVETLNVEAEWWYWESPPNIEGLSKLCAILPEEIRHVERDPLDAERMHRVALTRPLEFCVGQAHHVKHHLSIIDEQNIDGEVHCLQINTLTGQTRGFSDLLVVSDWLDYLDTLTFTEIERVQFQRNFSWFVKLASDDNELINAKRDELNEEGPPGAGSIKVIGEGEDWEAKSPQLELEDSVAFIKLIMLICFGGLIMPEHYFASGGDVNKATSANMDTPVWAFTRDRKGQIRAFLTRCVIRALRNLVRAGTLVGMTDEDLEFEIVSRDPDRSAYDLIGEMLKKLGEALTHGKTEGYLSDVEAARAYRTAASGLGLGDFPGVDQQSLDQAREIVRQRMEQQKEQLQQQFPTKLQESDEKKKSSAEYRDSLEQVLRQRLDRVSTSAWAARAFGEKMSGEASRMLASSGTEITKGGVEDALRRLQGRFLDEMPTVDLRRSVDSGREWVASSLAHYGLDVPTGGTQSASRPWHELTEWDLYRRVAHTTVKEPPSGADRSAGGRTRRLGQEISASIAYWASEDFQNLILSRAEKARKEGQTMQQFAGALVTDPRLADSLAGLTAQRIASNVQFAELRAAKFAEELMWRDADQINPGRLKLRQIRTGSVPCQKCDRGKGEVFSIRAKRARRHQLPLHRGCQCTHVPVVSGEAMDPGFARTLGSTLTAVADEFRSALEYPAVVMAGRVFTPQRGFLSGFTEEPATVVLPWGEGLSHAELCSEVQSMPLVRPYGYEQLLSHTTNQGRPYTSHWQDEARYAGRPQLYPQAMATLLNPDVTYFNEANRTSAFLKRIQLGANSSPRIYKVVVQNVPGQAPFIRTWYEEDGMGVNPTIDAMNISEDQKRLRKINAQPLRHGALWRL